MTEPVLQIDGLRVEFRGRGPVVTAVDGVSLEVHKGEKVAIVGESGCGKTTLGLAILRLLPEAGRVSAGEIRLGGRSLLEMSDEEIRRARGKDLAMTFQDPLSALNPLMTVGAQVEEAMTAQARIPAKEAARRVVPLLTQVAIPRPAERAKDYPHEFSGGMRQRSMIAMGIANDPAVLVADEPTTALDVTIQSQIVELLASLNESLGTAIVLITHNMRLVSELCDRVVVMYAGRVVEDGPLEPILTTPQHPYTWSLLEAVPKPSSGRGRRLITIPGSPPNLARSRLACRFEPRCRFSEDRCGEEEPPLAEVNERHRARCWVLMRNVEDTTAVAPPATARGRAKHPSSSPLLEMEDVSKHFRGTGGPPIRAVDGVSLHINGGETLGLIGESGCGKSTLARLTTRLLLPTGGAIRFNGSDLAGVKGRELRSLRRHMQMIFQDPFSSLDERQTVRAIVGEPLVNYHVARGHELRREVATLLELVGLGPDVSDRRPSELSGGQRQRVGIARALALKPSLVVCDEPVSSLDVSVQAQIVNLLLDLQAQFGLAYLFISHDLALVQQVADRIAVMYLGRIVESAPTDHVYEHPEHPYTRALLDAVSRPAGHPRRVLAGEVPSPADPPDGCRFHPRCPIARSPGVCDSQAPPLESHGHPGHAAACHFAAEPTAVAYVEGAPNKVRDSAL